MALKQLAPAFEPAVDLGMGEARQLLKMRVSPPLEFRAGAGLGPVVEKILAGRLVEVNAAAAGGKSTRLPAEIAKATSGLVVHLCPNAYLAHDLFKYVAANAGAGLTCKFVGTPRDEWPVAGVVLSSSCLVARWLEAGSVVMPECVVFHDESHESDAYSYVVRSLMPQVEAVRSYVTATATSAPAGFRSVETAGVMTKREFEDEGGAWDVFDPSKPWYPDSDTGNCLIFEDRKVRADALKRAFTESGWRAYRFHAGMAMQEFTEAMNLMRLKNAPCVAVIADSTFRSGFTMPVTRIIDSGVVSMVVARNGNPVRVERLATGLERYQAAARGARMPGQNTCYWSPSFEAPSIIHDLEASEVDWAALCIRLLGYRVPRELERSFGATMGVPRELAAVVRGKLPLAVLNADQLVPMDVFSRPGGRKSPYLSDEFELHDKPYDMHPSVSADTARKHGLQGLRMRRDSFASREDEGPVVQAPLPLRPVRRERAAEVARLADNHEVTGPPDELSSALRELYAGNESSYMMEQDKTYVPVGVGHGDAESGYFPGGPDAVVRQLAHDETHALHLGFDLHTRGVAVNMLFDRRNRAVCEVLACRGAISQARDSMGDKDEGAVREWTKRLVGSMSTRVHDIKVVDSVLDRLIHSFCSLAEVSMADHTAMAQQALVQSFQALPSRKRFVDTVDASARRDLRQGGQVHREGIGWKLPTVPMATQGRGMRAVLRPNSMMEWVAGPHFGTKVKYLDAKKD